MTEIGFYHLTATSLEKALPKLLEKAYQSGILSLVVTDSEARLETFNQLLWTYSSGAFLPHGSSKDAYPEKQPILLSLTEEATNRATLLAVTDGRIAAGEYARIIDLFDGQDEESVSAARMRWKSYKDQGHILTYWKQQENGGWEKRLSYKLR